jgi:hypothetical protein
VLKYLSWKQFFCQFTHIRNDSADANVILSAESSVGTFSGFISPFIRKLWLTLIVRYLLLSFEHHDLLQLWDISYFSSNIKIYLNCEASVTFIRTPIFTLIVRHLLLSFEHQDLPQLWDISYFYSNTMIYLNCEISVTFIRTPWFTPIMRHLLLLFEHQDLP